MVARLWAGVLLRLARDETAKGRGMTARRIRLMTSADLPALAEPCARCTFWEASLTDLASPADHRESAGAKRQWAEAVTERWGYCGVVAQSDGEMVGHLTMAPAAYVPRLGAFATTPVSQDAAVLMTVNVAEEMRGKGIGRQLVQAAAGLLVRRDIRALEAVGTERQESSCMLPTTWLQAVGFVVVRPHPITPRLRMDLENTLCWRPDLSAAWTRLTGLVVQPPLPEPAAFRPSRARSTPADASGC